MNTCGADAHPCTHAEAIAAVERSIDKLMRDFLAHPFAHRVEHSLHVDLYHLMRSEPTLATEVPIGDTGFTSRLVHKEWPSVHTFNLKPGTRPRRQSFDLAVLDRADVSQGTLEKMTTGRLVAPIAIELGLDYSIKHITGDLGKLTRNKVAHPYVVHLSRRRTSKASEVKEAIAAASPVRVAFAHLDLDAGTFHWKGLGDTEMQTHTYQRP